MLLSRHRLILSIGPNCLDSTWRQRQTQVSETLLPLNKNKRIEVVHFVEKDELKPSQCCYNRFLSFGLGGRGLSLNRNALLMRTKEFCLQGYRHYQSFYTTESQRRWVRLWMWTSLFHIALILWADETANNSRSVLRCRNFMENSDYLKDFLEAGVLYFLFIYHCDRILKYVKWSSQECF